MVLDSSRRKHFFDDSLKPRIVANSRGKIRIPATKDLAAVLRCADADFLSFLRKCLRWDPSTRLTAEKAFEHPWIQSGLIPTGSIPINTNPLGPATIVSSSSTTDSNHHSEIVPSAAATTATMRVRRPDDKSLASNRTKEISQLSNGKVRDATQSSSRTGSPNHPSHHYIPTTNSSVSSKVTPQPQSAAKKPNGTAPVTERAPPVNRSSSLIVTNSSEATTDLPKRKALRSAAQSFAAESSNAASSSLTNTVRQLNGPTHRSHHSTVPAALSTQKSSILPPIRSSNPSNSSANQTATNAAVSNSAKLDSHQRRQFVPVHIHSES
jgi:serine/threonine protein kinase